LEIKEAAANEQGDEGRHLTLLPLKLLVLGASGSNVCTFDFVASVVEMRAAGLWCMVRKALLLILKFKQQRRQATGKICGSGGSIKESACRELSKSGVTLPPPQY
jgi:hypothetical protein